MRLVSTWYSDYKIVGVSPSCLASLVIIDCSYCEYSVGFFEKGSIPFKEKIYVQLSDLFPGSARGDCNLITSDWNI